jgi:hypothetical protein
MEADGKNLVFTSLVATELPMVYGPNLPPGYFIKNLMRPHWDHHADPWTAFIPTHFPYEGPIFGRLRFNTPKGFPPLAEGIWYEDGRPFTGRQMDPAVCNTWVRLEVGLLTVIYLMKKRPECLAMLKTVGDIPIPSWFGYKRQFKNDKEANYAIIKSRKAFHSLIGLCSYALALCRDHDCSPPGWVNHLSTWVHPGWMEDLRISVAGTFNESVKRRGLLIDVSKYDRDQIIFDTMKRSGVPMWFWWGDQSKKFTIKQSFISELQPTSEAVRQALSWFHKPPSLPQRNDDHVYEDDQESSSVTTAMMSTFFPETCSTSATSVIEPDAAAIQHDIGQHPNNDWQSFFTERERSNAEIYNRASPKDLQKWENRRRQADQGMEPGAKGAVVYEWEEDDSGVFIRNRVERARVGDIFHTYGPSHKRFDPIRNEWDLHYAFDPDTPAPYDSDSDGDDGYPGPDPVLAIGADAEVEQIAQTFLEDMRETYRVAKNEMATWKFPTRELTEVMQRRYGLRLTGDVSVPAPPDYEPFIIPKLTGTILHLDLPRDKSTMDNLNLAVWLICNARFGNMTFGSNTLWDLSGLSSTPLIVNHRDLWHREVTRREGGSEAVSWVIGAYGYVYPVWHLLVADATTVLELLRVLHSSDSQTNPMSALLIHVVSTGIPFSRVIASGYDLGTPSRLPRHLFPNQSLHVVGANDEGTTLGPRWPQYVPDDDEYRTYWVKLNNFLEGPRGHLAFMMGGIIWRLAIHALGIEAAMTAVQCGAVVRASGNSSGGGYDELETLSPIELEFICGTYRIYTGIGMQTKHASWWPPHHSWSNSGLDLGFWTPNAEEWFQKRIEAIRDNPRSALKTPTQWNNTLKYYKAQVNNFREGSNRAAQIYLSNA